MTNLILCPALHMGLWMPPGIIPEHFWAQPCPFPRKIIINKIQLAQSYTWGFCCCCILVLILNITILEISHNVKLGYRGLELLLFKLEHKYYFLEHKYYFFPAVVNSLPLISMVTCFTYSMRDWCFPCFASPFSKAFPVTGRVSGRPPKTKSPLK